MSTIPYNYGKYMDDKVSMSNSGTVDAGRQVQSPASAGSRGLAKTTQFTKDPTQMKMGNSPIAESMVEIRNILNRIDGVNVPTNEINELADDDKIEFTKVMLDISQIKDRVEALSVDEEAKKSAIQSLTNAEEALVALDETAVKEDADESRYYEYTGKAFAIRPSGDSVWANKADIPSVINVESIMISHYPDMDGYVELTMEHDGPWEIYTDKAVEAALEKTLGMPSGSIKWSEQGQQEKGRAHFDVASTAIGKVAGSSMFKQVRAEESYEPFPEEDEMTFEDDDAFYEAFGELGFPEDENELFDAEYRGRKVPLNKPMRGDVKKFKVYVKDPKSGNVKKVNFGHGGSSARKAGQKTMKIRKSNPKARKSFRARHNCANPGPKTRARYWSCRAW